LENEGSGVEAIDGDGGCGEVQDGFFYSINSNIFSPAVVVTYVTHVYIIGVAVGTRSDGDVFAVFYAQGEGGVSIEIKDGSQATVGSDGEEAAGVSAVIMYIEITGVGPGGGDAGSFVHARVVQEGVGGYPQVFVAAGCKNEYRTDEHLTDGGEQHAVI